MQGKRLILFTDAYPFGTAETFLEAELEHLSRVFDTITMVPLRYGDSHGSRSLPANARATTPILREEGQGRLLLQGVLNASPLLPMVRDLTARRSLPSPVHLRKWLEATCTARAVLSSPIFLNLAEEADESTVLYFYWAAGAAWALPFLSWPGPVVSRFHGFDIYEERKEFDGYMPFRRTYLRSLDWGICVSEHGRKYLLRKYPESRDRLRLFPLGVSDAGLSKPGSDGILHLLSCARMVALKRLEIIVEALHLVDFPVEWTHFGDGPTRQAVEEAASTLPDRIRCFFPGRLANREVRRWYHEHPGDVFVNMSKTEGAPVAVMEALSAGIPVVATDVGGTGELVDDTVGILLSKDAGPGELADALRRLHADRDHRLSCADKARERWSGKFNADRNFGAFAEFLSGDAFHKRAKPGG